MVDLEATRVNLHNPIGIHFFLPNLKDKPILNQSLECGIWPLFDQSILKGAMTSLKSKAGSIWRCAKVIFLCFRKSQTHEISSLYTLAEVFNHASVNQPY